MNTKQMETTAKNAAKAIELRKRGVAIKDIAKQLSVGPSAVHYYLYARQAPKPAQTNGHKNGHKKSPASSIMSPASVPGNTDKNTSSPQSLFGSFLRDGLPEVGAGIAFITSALRIHEEINHLSATLKLDPEVVRKKMPFLLLHPQIVELAQRKEGQSAVNS